MMPPSSSPLANKEHNNREIPKVQSPQNLRHTIRSTSTSSAPLLLIRAVFVLQRGTLNDPVQLLSFTPQMRYFDLPHTIILPVKTRFCLTSFVAKEIDQSRSFDVESLRH